MTMPGERIRARRKELNLTQRALAKLVKVAHVTISQWETGDSEPGGKNLFSLSRPCNARLHGFFTAMKSAPRRPHPPAKSAKREEKELLSLFASLPESEKERHLSDLREKVADFNRLFEELLKARNNK
jgi:transcriptional regulator with XRE-family HTH domain